MIFAIVPAAGKSERMRVPKLLLPLGQKRIIEWVLDALEGSRVECTVVVVPPQAQELVDVVSHFQKAAVAQLSHPTDDMRASILHGIETVANLARPSAPDAFLVALGDQPTITSHAVDQVIFRFSENHSPIVMPTFAGRRGHPVLFDLSLVDQVRGIPKGRGLDYIVHLLADRVDLVQIEDGGVLLDVDTPDDYQQVRRLLDKRRDTGSMAPQGGSRGSGKETASRGG